MKKTLIFIILNLLFFLNIWAGNIPDSFKHLKKINLTTCNNIEILYNKELIVDIFNKNNSFFKSYTENSWSIYEILVFKIPKLNNKQFKLSFTDSWSCDPTFDLEDLSINKKRTSVFREQGTRIIINGTKNIYINGHINSMFNKRRKFTYNHKINSFQEVKQPFLYVGNSFVFKIPLSIYYEKEFKNEIAVLPVNSPIEVLLADKDEKYLVKTPFGLVGWAKIKKVIVNGATLTNIKDIYYVRD